MDKKYLHRVIDQIMSETRIDYDKERVYTPFIYSFIPTLISSSSFYFFSFSYHCKNIYGLNEQEIEYVWDEYIKIIRDKTNG